MRPPVTTRQRSGHNRAVRGLTPIIGVRAVRTPDACVTAVTEGLQAPFGSADRWPMTPLSPVDAMSLLFARPEVDLELDGGGLLRVTRMTLEGDRAVVTAPRLSVATAMTLTGRV